MDKLTERKRRRFQFLRHLYEATGGDDVVSVNDQELGSQLGFTPDETDQVVRYLEEEHLIN